MRTRPHISSLIIVAGLAIVLTWTMAGQATARGTFQSPLEPGATETSTPTPDLTNPGMEVTLTPTQMAAGPGAPAATAPGFLPAPTLVNPSDLIQGRPALSQPGGAPLVGPAQAPEPTATPAVQPVPGAAQLIDNAIVALGYFWLCCGFIVVALLALAAVWLARRSRRR